LVPACLVCGTDTNIGKARRRDHAGLFQRRQYPQRKGKAYPFKGKGYPFIGGARKFRDCEFAFLHPKAANGVLLEFIDDKTEVPES